MCRALGVGAVLYGASRGRQLRPPSAHCCKPGLATKINRSAGWRRPACPASTRCHRRRTAAPRASDRPVASMVSLGLQAQLCMCGGGCAGDRAPAGWPITNTGIAILSTEESQAGLAVAKPGELGEVCVFGEGLAAGYLRCRSQIYRCLLQGRTGLPGPLPGHDSMFRPCCTFDTADVQPGCSHVMHSACGEMRAWSCAAESAQLGSEHAPCSTSLGHAKWGTCVLRCPVTAAILLCFMHQWICRNWVSFTVLLPAETRFNSCWTYPPAGNMHAGPPLPRLLLHLCAAASSWARMLQCLETSLHRTGARFVCSEQETLDASHLQRA